MLQIARTASGCTLACHVLGITFAFSDRRPSGAILVMIPTTNRKLSCVGLFDKALKIRLSFPPPLYNLLSALSGS